MKVSEFIRSDFVDGIENPTVERLVVECLEKLHSVFGFDDNFYSADNWILDELDSFEDKLEINSSEYIKSVNATARKMESEILIPYLLGKDSPRKRSLFRYKERTLFSFDRNSICIPLILAMQELMPICTNNTHDVGRVATASRLIQCAIQTSLMIEISYLWACESGRNFSEQDLKRKEKEFDRRKENAIRKLIVEEVVTRELLDNEEQEINGLIRRIKPIITNRLEELYNKNELELGHVELTPSVLNRWVREFMRQFNDFSD